MIRVDSSRKRTANNSNIIRASSIHLGLSSYKDASPLLMHQWYVSHFNRVVRVGKAEEPYPWTVTSISATPDTHSDNSSVSSGAPKKRWKKESIVLLPSAAVYLSFPTYRVVVYLDMSRSSWTVGSIGSPLGVLTSSLLSIVASLSEATRHGDSSGSSDSRTSSSTRATRFQLSVIAHSPELDETWSVWQGEITTKSDVLILHSILRSLDHG